MFDLTAYNGSAAMAKMNIFCLGDLLWIACAIYTIIYIYGNIYAYVIQYVGWIEMSCAACTPNIILIQLYISALKVEESESV